MAAADRPREHPGRLDRRRFEACVFTYLAQELRIGDVAVRGSEAYADWAAKMLSWEQCEPLLDELCAEAGLPATAGPFTEQLREKLAAKAVEVERKGKDRSPTAIALEEQIKERMPERSVLEIPRADRPRDPVVASLRARVSVTGRQWGPASSGLACRHVSWFSRMSRARAK